MRTPMMSLLPLLAACGHKVTVTWVSPAEIGLDSDIEKVLVINRSVAGTDGQVVLDLAEGLATGEGFDTDHDTSELALDALRDILAETDRFEVVSFRVNGETVDTSLWDGALDERQIVKLCARADCDAIVALDALDTDTRAQVALTDPVEKTFEGTATTDLVATFRTYDADGDIVDEARMRVDGSATAEGDRADAMAAVRSAGGVQLDLAAEVGAAYGRRIAPHDTEAMRSLYRTGDERLRDAIDHVKANDWAGAADLWTDIVKKGSDRDEAKARHNLAVYAEVTGDLARAVSLARKADVELDRARTHTYLLDLEARRIEARVLEQQLPTVDPSRTGIVRS